MDPKTTEMTIEVPEPAKAEPEQKLTAKELVEGGLTPAEVEAAKKHGLVREEAGSQPEPKPEGDASEPSKEPANADPSNPTGPTTTPNGIVFDKKGDRRAELAYLEEHPEHEDDIIRDYSPNEKAMYFLRKKEKTRRQTAEIERDQVLIQKRALEQRVSEIESKLKEKPTEKTQDEDFNLDEPESSEGKDKPLTEADLERIEKDKAEKAKKDHEAQAERAARNSRALAEMEAEAKARYTDFDAVTNHTVEIMKAFNEQRLEAMFPDKKELTKVLGKIREFIVTANNADQFTADQYNPVDVGYELGTLHPGFKKQPAHANGQNGKQEHGEPLPPEKVDRMVQNATRRGSSASLSGGGGSRRPVSVNDITLEQAAALPLSEFRKLPREVRERLARQ